VTQAPDWLVDRMERIKKSPQPSPDEVKTQLQASAQVWTGFQFSLPERQKQALASCEKWLGVPHVNRVAVHPTGIDCIHFVHEVLIDSGVLPPADLGRYTLTDGTFNPSDYLKRVFLAACYSEERHPGEAEFGDIVIFKTGKTSAHCGFYTPELVWHSLSGRAVIRSPWNHWKHEADCLVRIVHPGFKIEPKRAIRLCREKPAE